VIDGVSLPTQLGKFFSNNLQLADGKSAMPLKGNKED
jgi:hypothetical protein